jgi:hypothetical protein
MRSRQQGYSQRFQVYFPALKMELFSCVTSADAAVAGPVEGKISHIRDNQGASLLYVTTHDA